MKWRFFYSMSFCLFIFGWMWMWTDVLDAAIAAGMVAFICGLVSGHDAAKGGR